MVEEIRVQKPSLTDVSDDIQEIVDSFHKRVMT